MIDTILSNITGIIAVLSLIGSGIGWAFAWRANASNRKANDERNDALVAKIQLDMLESFDARYRQETTYLSGQIDVFKKQLSETIAELEREKNIRRQDTAKIERLIRENRSLVEANKELTEKLDGEIAKLKTAEASLLEAEKRIVVLEKLLADRVINRGE